MFPGEGAPEYCEAFNGLIQECHAVRAERNLLLHSAFVELKSGGDVYGILRVDTKLKVHPENCEPRVDHELLSEEGLNGLMGRLARVCLCVNYHHTQLISWLPFDSPPQVDFCGLKDFDEFFKKLTDGRLREELESEWSTGTTSEVQDQNVE